MYRHYWIGVAAMLLLAACKGNNPTVAELPKIGEVVDSASMAFSEDSLNKFNFKIAVVADSYIALGAYRVHAYCGPDSAVGVFRLPKGGEFYRPSIRKALSANTYTIGFKIPNDTTFYDYFSVKASHKSFTMDYIKTYTLQ
jgi:hypothetical protein